MTAPGAKVSLALAPSADPAEREAGAAFARAQLLALAEALGKAAARRDHEAAPEGRARDHADSRHQG